MAGAVILCRKAVYPRVRGGTTAKAKRTIDGKGLSPRARGNQSILTYIRVHQRSIPACAGEPAVHRFRIVAEQVYPRVRGGTV